MNLWSAVLGMGLITYAIRLSFVVLGERVQLSTVFRRGLGYVPTAVLSAIILPEVLQPGGTLDISLGNGRLFAGLVAALVAWRTRNVSWTIAAGMIVLWLWTAVFGT
jgi:branched-subunit amino acid transport protein